MEREVLDNWTAKQAWEHFYGRNSSKPDPDSFDVEELSELDTAVAQFFGDQDDEDLVRRAHAALKYIFPRVFLLPLPPMPADQESIKSHLQESVKEALKKYDAVSGSERSRQAKRIGRIIREWSLGEMTRDDWFVLWDAMGVTGVNVRDIETSRFYDFAHWNWFYLGMNGK